MLRLIPERRSDGDRALLGPWRLLGRAQGEFRHRAQGRQARGAPRRRTPASATSPRNVRWPAPTSSRASRSRAASPPAERAASHRNLRPRLRSLSMARKITPSDILPVADYAGRRKELRQAVVALKRVRRMEVGPVATLHFESFETMRMQIQEMLHIEKGGAEQLAGELAAYNPLMPDGHELVATVLFEIDDPAAPGQFPRPPRRRRADRLHRGRRREGPRPAGGRSGPHLRRGQGLLGAVHPFPLHASPDRPLQAAGRAGDHRLRPSGLRPYERDARARAPGPGRGFRLGRTRA